MSSTGALVKTLKDQTLPSSRDGATTSRLIDDGWEEYTNTWLLKETPAGLVITMESYRSHTRTHTQFIKEGDWKWAHCISLLTVQILYSSTESLQYLCLVLLSKSCIINCKLHLLARGHGMYCIVTHCHRHCCNRERRMTRGAWHSLKQ